MNKGPISQFIQHHYRHFNAAALVDAAKGYEKHLQEEGKMMITLAGAMSTGELGVSLAEMIRQGRVDIISCTGANLEEDIMNLVAHSHYKRIPNYRDLTPREEYELMEKGLTTSAACLEIGISRDVLNGWLRKGRATQLAGEDENNEYRRFLLRYEDETHQIWKRITFVEQSAPLADVQDCSIALYALSPQFLFQHNDGRLPGKHADK